MPLQDQTFLAIDRALGMDPGVIARFVNDRPQLVGLLRDADTASSSGSCWRRRSSSPRRMRLIRLQVFVGAFGISLAVTLAISALVPAIGTYYGLDVPLSDYPRPEHDTSTRRSCAISWRCARDRCGISNCSNSPASSHSRAFMPPPPCSIVGAVAGARHRRHRRHHERLDDHRDARDRRPLHDRRHRWRRACGVSIWAASYCRDRALRAPTVAAARCRSRRSRCRRIEVSRASPRRRFNSQPADRKSTCLVAGDGSSRSPLTAYSASLALLRYPTPRFTGASA